MADRCGWGRVQLWRRPVLRQPRVRRRPAQLGRRRRGGGPWDEYDPGGPDRPDGRDRPRAAPWTDRPDRCDGVDRGDRRHRTYRRQRRHRADGADRATGDIGNTGPTGATGATGATGPAGSSAYISAFEGPPEFIPASGSVQFDTIEGTVGLSPLLNPVTGQFTVLQSGTYNIFYRVSPQAGTSLQQIQVDLNGILVQPSNVQSVTGQPLIDMVTVNAAAGDNISLVNGSSTFMITNPDGASVTISQVG